MRVAGVARASSVFFKKKTAYEIGSSDWSSDVCSDDEEEEEEEEGGGGGGRKEGRKVRRG